MGHSEHMEAIAAEIARIEEQLDRNPLWQELKTFEAAGLVKAAGPRVLSLLESLETDPLYVAHGKLVEARNILQDAETQREAQPDALPRAAASGEGQPGRSDQPCKSQRRRRKRAARGAAGAARRSSRKKQLPRTESLESRLARMDRGDADASGRAGETEGTPDKPERDQTRAARDAGEASPAANDTPRGARRRPFLSRSDVPEADVDIRPSRGSGRAHDDETKGD